MSNESENAEQEARRAQKHQEILLDQQMRSDRAELEAKRQSVFKERLNILNSQRGQIWSPQGTYKPTMPNNKPLVVHHKR